MRYMLDTNICVFAIRQQTPSVLAALRAHAAEGIGISSIAASELWFGVEKSASAKNAKALTQFLSPLEIAPFDEAATHIAGRIRAALEAKGKTIGPLDTLIAAHALALDVTLVTNNTKEFKRVAGLRVVDWTKALGRRVELEEVPPRSLANAKSQSEPQAFRPTRAHPREQQYETVSSCSRLAHR